MASLSTSDRGWPVAAPATSAVPRWLAYQAIPCTQPVSVRAVAPSSTTIRSALAAAQSSDGAAPPGSVATATAANSGIVVPVERRNQLAGDDVAGLVVIATDEGRPAPSLDLAIQLGKVVLDVVR